MKKIIATLLLLQAFSASSQLGVTTIKSNDFTPIDQWFSLRGRRQENKVYYQNEDSIADTVLDGILKPWDLTIQDGEIDENTLY